MEPLSAGTRLGAHVLTKRLGVGSYGEVWLARSPDRPERAMKISPLESATDAATFRLEFEKLRPLRLPHVVRVYETGVQGRWAWFTMDVARGIPIDAWVQAADSLEDRVRRLCHAGAQVALGIASTHRVGLAHRDLKPANIHVDDDGMATILDFGTARFGATRESSSAIMGTIPYMAPEQRVGLPHDLRVDAYALGATLHECLSGIPAGKWRPGRRRPPLAVLGRAVPRALSWVVDRLLSLDPAHRPTADEVMLLLRAIRDNEPLPPVPWPSPPTHYGDATRLMTGGPFAVVGPTGSGRARYLEEARWQWYRKGYRSMAARCVPDRPFGALRELLAELFRTTVAHGRRDLAGGDAAVLQAIWPGLPVEVSTVDAWPPDPRLAGEAVARVFGRHAPIAIALFDVDDADVGTTSVLPHLRAALPKGVHLWATSRRPMPGFRQIRPPSWNAEAASTVMPELLPEGVAPEGPSGRTPLESCAAAWRALARWRKEPGPAQLEPGTPEATHLQALAVLDEPFPTAVARKLAPDISALIAAGHLLAASPPGDASAGGAGAAGVTDEPTESTDLLLRRVLPPEDTSEPDSLEEIRWLRFADPGTRMLARASGPSIRDRERAAAAVWTQLSDSDMASADRTLGIARHAARAGTPHPSVFAAAAEVALARGEPSEVDRWLQLRALHGGATEEWAPRYARIAADLELDPGRVHRAGIRALGRTATDDRDRARAALLMLRFEATQGESATARSQGSRWADGLRDSRPAMAGRMSREVAVAAIAEGDIEEAVQMATHALAMATEHPGSRPGGAPSIAEIDATITLTRALLDLGERNRAIATADPLLTRCVRTGRIRGVARLSVLLAEAAAWGGDRDTAATHLARSHVARRRHPHPRVHAQATALEARLAVDQGDPTAADILISEGRAISASHGFRRQRRDLATLSLELAVHLANPELARHARIERASADCDAPGDQWSAALARWRWLTGDLAGALEATTKVDPHGMPRIVCHAERGRLLLVAGRYPEARSAARQAAEVAEQAGLTELARFSRLVEGAASAWSDRRYLPLLASTQRAGWTHLYLGGLHLDAIRRQLRGDDARPCLRDLRARSLATGHRLYAALSRADGW